jgi:nucleoside-diphosphate-sugar epimerase
MKILIFGGTRFMGRYASRQFVDAGYEVAIANRGTSKPVEGVQSIQCDRSIAGAVDVLKGMKFEAVLDFSAYPSQWVREAGAVLAGNTRRYLFISSGAVYKKSEIFPIQEHFERAPQKLHPVYSEEKIKGEQALVEFSDKGYFETVSCRLPYVMGIDNYEDREAFVLSRIINDRPVLLPNAGQAVHSFIYAGDVARALFKLVTAGSHVNRQAFNLAMPEGVSSLGFVDICARVAGKPARIHPINPNLPELQQETFNLKDMLFPYPDVSGLLDSRKLQSFTGFSASYNLTDCIQIFYQDMLAKGQTTPRNYERENKALALLKLQ